MLKSLEDHKLWVEKVLPYLEIALTNNKRRAKQVLGENFGDTSRYIERHNIILEDLLKEAKDGKE